MRKKKGVEIDKDTKQKVLKFYEDDENSRLCPGKKGCVKVITNGQKSYMQKRLILSNLNELFVAFKKTHPECKIGRSKFCELRPKWCILAGASGTHSVCVCIYHQNIKLMIDGAKLNVDYKDLLEMLVCDTTSYNCMTNACDQCPGQQALIDLIKDSEEEELMLENIEFKQWVTVDRSEMVTMVKPRDEFVETFVQGLYNLKFHHYVSKVQGRVLKEKKENLLDTECIVLADFSENYTFIVQDEIQGYHWVNDQATVHPFVVYLKEQDKIRSHCLFVLSDYREHSTAVVHAFLTEVINHIKTLNPNLKKIIYFSDGSGSQYKNKKNFTNICKHKCDFGVEGEWHFFASCHGKNSCDGVGGTTKRVVTRASLQRPKDGQILNVDQLFTFCNEHITGITYFLIKKEAIENHAATLDERFNKCQRVVGTRKFHKFQAISENEIRCYLTSDTDKFEDHVTLVKEITLSLQEKDLIACIYEGQWWIGEIESISLEHNDVYVHFYHPPGPRTSFKESVADKVNVPVRNVLRKISALELTTATGRSHVISQELSEEISYLFNLNR